MYVCMFIMECMHACMHVCMYVCMFLSLQLQIPTGYRTGFWVLATALVVVGLVTRVMVLGMQKKGGLVSSSSPFGLIAVAGRL